jgi:eukaryotic-like serine/threonine-protein kinase
MLPARAICTEPWGPPDDGQWGLRRGDEVAPGRRVLRRLGDGGAHEAFLVETGAADLAVAKLPRPRFARDVHRLVSLRDEGEALSRLRASAVPRHLDTVLSGAHPHLLMEYVAGPTLLTAIASRGALPASLVAGLGRALALGLAAIARAGWVHLDVKPANIVLNIAPRLIDFELARPAADAARMTHPTGTWHYMPPEQRAAGTASGLDIGPAADVYALAFTLCEALTGRPLERSPEPVPPQGLVGGLLADALARAPRDRPRADELAAALAAHADDELDCPAGDLVAGRSGLDCEPVRGERHVDVAARRVRVGADLVRRPYELHGLHPVVD